MNDAVDKPDGSQGIPADFPLHIGPNGPVYRKGTPMLQERAEWDGAALIAYERERQQEKGWDADHDDNVLNHAHGQLVSAAIAYALTDRDPLLKRERFWPWEDGWKPTPDDRIRELTKAGALIAAEIDRLLRRG